MGELIYKKEAMRRLEAAYDGRVAGLRDKDDFFAEGIERTLDFAAGIEYAMGIIGNIKAADAAPVVRCKDCAKDGLTTCPICWIENHTLQFVNHDPEFYCGAAERKN